ncbi:MAG: lysylphosphatidylglycerol synthase transmembrane domain-containing protein [Pseudolysinimonas sp.]
MSVVPPRTWRFVQLGFGLVVVAATITIVGTGPLIQGVLAVSPAAILLAGAFTAIATLAASWRWKTVSGALGLPISWTTAVTAYYRSQFLNTVLPGGVIGDVHRAYRQGRHGGARNGDQNVELLGAGRAVATERVAGQVVQGALTVVVLAVLGLTGSLLGVVWIGAGVLAVVAVALSVTAATVSGRRLLGRELSLLRLTFGSAKRSLSIVVASALVVAAHSATFVVACLAVGVGASPRELVALAVVALAAAALPLSIGGWGPREAASASAFAIVGLSAGAGLAASTAFGVLTMVSVLPGLIVLIVEWAAIRSRAVSAA